MTDQNGPVNGGFGPSMATCPAGTTLVGGGANVTPTPPAAGAVLKTYPAGGTVWVAEAIRLAGGGSISLIAYALCAPT